MFYGEEGSYFEYAAAVILGVQIGDIITKCEISALDHLGSCLTAFSYEEF